MCFVCGKKILVKDRDKHHAIPKCMKPKFNVLFFLHNECHTKLNELYVSQQKKNKEKKIKNIINSAIIGLTKVYDKVEEGEK